MTLYINGEIPVAKLRGDDEKCLELHLSNKGYYSTDAIIIASLLKVSCFFWGGYPPTHVACLVYFWVG